MAKIYEHACLEVSVYGNVVALLRKHAAKQGVHIDIGCGYGAIADPVRDQLNLTYVGFDGAQDGLEVLRTCGFETHLLDLRDPETAEAAIRTALAGRQVASISLIDTLEHLTNGRELLEMLRHLVDEQCAPLIISVPNVTHKDIAIKALIGRFDYTTSGLLDITHSRFFTELDLTENCRRKWLAPGRGQGLAIGIQRSKFSGGLHPIAGRHAVGQLSADFCRPDQS